MKTLYTRQNQKSSLAKKQNQPNTMQLSGPSPKTELKYGTLTGILIRRHSRCNHMMPLHSQPSSASSSTSQVATTRFRQNHFRPFSPNLAPALWLARDGWTTQITRHKHHDSHRVLLGRPFLVECYSHGRHYQMASASQQKNGDAKAFARIENRHAR